MNTRLRRLVCWLLTLRLRQEWVDFVLGDLEEEYRARRAASARAADLWFWRQTIRCLFAPPPVLPHSRQLHPVPSAGDPIVRTLLADLRYGFRVLFRAPGFAISVIAVLALGIGANTAIFSIVNAVLLRPLPFEQSDRLVRLFHVPPQATFPGMATFSLSPANFLDWQRDSRSFSGLAAYNFRQLTLTG